ncbi:thioredoxin domain-containing protein [Mycobacterium sp. NAZ190054]|uniref:DsbA family protein n=1 Tax=Mycobacterium sp. NAZ190054 TaxID=1747766 RepID=UPI00079A1AD9|nr:thioredoxin domain-containing protein [Mycobacterium sp. NAZ190054]KWX66872.1 protein-disulfide isomerase [Mycobacterium sp. NAZ190054]
MHWTRPLAALSALGLLMTTVGCTTQVSGVARVDPTAAPLALTEDGFGVVAGFDDAPAKIEIYTEPQCSHCSDLQYDFGDELAYNITVGTLQVTYRPLTFLDDDYNGYSAKVANALFLAADAVGDSAATGTQLQRFVYELWINQQPGGPEFTGDELRDMAADAGVPDVVADHIGTDAEAVDVVEMDETNFDLLFDIDRVETGTPTVFDLNAGEKIDIYDDAWLADLVAG